jgi:hypothetical protein
MIEIIEDKTLGVVWTKEQSERRGVSLKQSDRVQDARSIIKDILKEMGLEDHVIKGIFSKKNNREYVRARRLVVYTLRGMFIIKDADLKESLFINKKHRLPSFTTNTINQMFKHTGNFTMHYLGGEEMFRKYDDWIKIEMEHFISQKSFKKLKKYYDIFEPGTFKDGAITIKN